MNKNCTIITNQSKFECVRIEREDKTFFWTVDFKQDNSKARGSIELPGHWAITRVVQYLEIIDQAV